MRMWNVYLPIAISVMACRNKPIEVSTDDSGVYLIDNDMDGFTNDVDCDDWDPMVHPEMDERCDGVDQNCNGEVDEGVNDDFYADLDGDGFGDPENSVKACEIPAGYVPFGTDCDDSNPDVFVGALEICNDFDDDCDGLIDEDLVQGLFFDADGDGYGDPNLPNSNCNLSEGYVPYGDDCDDNNPDIHPFNVELCDGIDNNCNDIIDEGVGDLFYADVDGDGYGDAGNTLASCVMPTGYVTDDRDCDDNNPEHYPNAPEYCNGIDDDCDTDVDEDPVDSPLWYFDIDGDGIGSAFIIAYECAAPAGYVDTFNDCDDTNPTIYPGATEYCNNKDNDCDGWIDDNAVDASWWYADFDRDDFGDANNSIYQCDQPFDYVFQALDCDDGNDDVYPGAPEYCNGIDDDCDGQPDNDTIDAFEYFLDDDGDGFGDAGTMQITCQAPANHVLDDSDCDDGDSSIYPGAYESCDGVDSNCDGFNFYELDLNGDGLLGCEQSVWFRNASSNPTNPNGGSSQAASYLVNAGVSIQQYYHGNNYVTASLLQNYGLYVHHGANDGGAIRAYTNAEAYALQNWVYNGGRMLYIGYNSEFGCDITDSLPSQFGISCAAGNSNWSGSTQSFVTHPITNALNQIGGKGGESWTFTGDAIILADINGYAFVTALEYGQGKVVFVANQFPFLNSGNGFRINYGDNEQLVQNIWTWLLE